MSAYIYTYLATNTHDFIISGFSDFHIPWISIFPEIWKFILKSENNFVSTKQKAKKLCIFYFVFQINFISGRFCNFSLPHHLGISPHLKKKTKHFISLLIQGFLYCYIFGWYFASDVLLVCRKEGTMFLFSPLLFILSYILIFQEEFYLTQHFGFLGPCWDTVAMSLSQMTDKLLEIQQLIHALMQTQSVLVCQVMSFFGQDQFFHHCYMLPSACSEIYVM